jgi:hypothetical protein
MKTGRNRFATPAWRSAGILNVLTLTHHRDGTTAREECATALMSGIMTELEVDGSRSCSRALRFCIAR